MDGQTKRYARIEDHNKEDLKAWKRLVAIGQSNFLWSNSTVEPDNLNIVRYLSWTMVVAGTDSKPTSYCMRLPAKF